MALNNFDDFWCCGDGLETSWFSMALMEGAELSYVRFVVIWFVPRLAAVTKQYGEVLQHAKYNIRHAGIKGYGKPGCKL